MNIDVSLTRLSLEKRCYNSYPTTDHFSFSLLAQK